MIVQVSKAVAILSNGLIIKLLKSRECPPPPNNHQRRRQSQQPSTQFQASSSSSWPIIFDIDDAPSLSFARNKLLNKRKLSAERIEEERSATAATSTCYLVFVFLY